MLLLQVLQKRQLASTATHVPASLETCRGTGVRGKFVQLPEIYSQQNHNSNVTKHTKMGRMSVFRKMVSTQSFKISRLRL